MDARKVAGSITPMLTYLKRGWDILLHLSFFHSHSNSHLLLQHPTAAAVAPAQHHPRGWTAADCAVCLSKIEEGDQVVELTCRHAFHKVCLDRWSKYSFFTRRRDPTCPLCRRSLTAAPAGAPEVLVFDFARLICSNDTRRQTWWLR